MKPLLFAAADERYYDKFGKAFVNSAEHNGMKAHVVNGGKMHATAACFLRYRLLPELLDEHPAVLALDIDTIIRKPIDIPDDWDAGFFIRENEGPRLKALGAILYVSNRAVGLTIDLRADLAWKTEWLDDQVALYKMYNAHRSALNIGLFDRGFIDWTPSNAVIWQGKGNFKDHPDFQKLVKQYREY